MADLDEGKSPEELEFEKNESERTKINIVEAAIVLIATAMADLAELIPLFGIVVGFFFSVAVLIWSYFKGMYTTRRRIMKIALMIGGPLLELLTVGLFPETFTLLAAILLHNYGETKHIEAIASRLSGKKRPK